MMEFNTSFNYYEIQMASSYRAGNNSYFGTGLNVIKPNERPFTWTAFELENYHSKAIL